MLILATLSLALASPATTGPGGALERALQGAQARLERGATVLADRSDWDNAWEVETEHYRIRTTANWYLGVRLGENLERMVAFFREIAGTKWEPPTPLRVFLFDDLAGYTAFGDEHGAHHSSILGSFYATAHEERPVAMYLHPNPKLVGMWATHSAYHQFAGSAFSRVMPTWFDEGLAAYFAGAYWDPEYLASEFRRVANSRAFVPLATLLQEPIDSYPADPHTRFVELGMMFNYLLHHRPETMTQKNEDGIVLLAPAADYVARMLRGKDVTDNPVHELVTVRLEELEADLLEFAFE